MRIVKWSEQSERLRGSSCLFSEQAARKKVVRSITLRGWVSPPVITGMTNKAFYTGLIIHRGHARGM